MSAAHRRRAFTLTEITVVLALIGLVLGGIWVASGKIYKTKRTNQAVQQVLTVANNFRGLYNQGYADTGNLTQLAVNNGMFSQDTINPNNCTSAAPNGNDGAGVTPCPVNPWSGEISVTGSGASAYCLNGCTAATLNHFQIKVWGVGRECPAFMAAIINGATAIGLNYVASTAYPTAYAVSAATLPGIDNIAKCSGDVTLQFNL